MVPAPAVFQAVASPRRQAILRLVWRRELAAGAIAAAMPDISFGAVSQHLGDLARLGLIDARAEHRHRFYRARPDAFGVLRDALERMWDDALWRLKIEAELEQARRGPLPARRHPRSRASSKRSKP